MTKKQIIKLLEYKATDSRKMCQYYMDKDGNGNPFYIGQVIILMEILDIINTKKIKEIDGGD